MDALVFGASHIIRIGYGDNQAKASLFSSTVYRTYVSDDVGTQCQLSASDLVQVAILAGNDYLPQGLPGCGMKTASAGSGTLQPISTDRNVPILPTLSSHASITVNWGLHGSHVDNDLANVCAVIPSRPSGQSDWSGGALVLPQLKLVLELSESQVLHFDLSRLIHLNTPTMGHHTSIVLSAVR